MDALNDTFYSGTSKFLHSAIENSHCVLPESMVCLTTES